MVNSTKFKPLLLDVKLAHKNKRVQYLNNGTAKILLDDGRTSIIPPYQQYDLTQATIFGLNERLTMSSNSPVIDKKGRTLREEFNTEWQKYSTSLANAKKNSIDYGVYAYYEEKNELVRFCKPFWHKVVAVASSSKLYSDPKDSLSWKEVRQILASTTIAVAGCSVGNSIIHSSIMDLRPDNIKIADKSLYKMENINRVRLSYSEMVESNQKRQTPGDLLLKNKAFVTASQIYSIDPFINVFVYPEGITENSIKKFFKGAGNEPVTDILIEEVDDPRIKILLRQEAKKNRIPLIMVTDVGSCVQLDIIRFDKKQQSNMTYGTKDSDLTKSMEEVYRNPGDRKIFFKFVDCLIGVDYRQEELKKIIEQKTEIPTSTIIPQLGSTIAVAGGIVAEAIARIRLGYNYPSRVIFNKRTFKTKIYN